MDSNTIQYFFNSKMNQLRRTASLPGNSINAAILTQAIYKFSSSNWKHRCFWGENTSFIYAFITLPHSTVSTKKQLLFSLMWIQQTCSAWGALCAHAVEQHMDMSTPSRPGAIRGKGARTYHHQRCESWALWALASGWTPPASLPPWCDIPACVQCDGPVQTAVNLHHL